MNEKKSSSPIGIFDSGVGGLTVLTHIKKNLPNEKIIYIADNLFSPYGNLSLSNINSRSKKIIKKLISLNCKLIIVACNTITTNVITNLRKEFDTPLIGIEPGIKPASLNSKSGVIGVLATKSTLSSSLFSKSIKVYNSNIKIIEKEGVGLIEIIENNKINELKTKKILNSYIAPMIEKNADHLVLGCTHYPHLIPVLNKVLKNKMKIVDTGIAVAEQTKRILIQHKLLSIEQKNKLDLFFQTGDSLKINYFLKDQIFKKIIL